MKSFGLEKYNIKYDQNIKAFPFYDRNCYGITFVIGNFKYQLVHNYDMQTERLLIQEDVGHSFLSKPSGLFSFKDLPFKPETFGFLPEGVSSEVING